MAYKPPYTLDSDTLVSISQITKLIGQIEGRQLLSGDLKLRKANKVKTVRSSLAIEGNTLDEAQITDIIDGKTVLGSPREILEVRNALRVYDTLATLDAREEDHLLESHLLLMEGLIEDAGRYRNKGVGVVDGDKVIHVGPPHARVPELMGNLFDYLRNYPEEVILKSCVFHYEFEFIHPFSDGNGRMGRLWQTVIMKQEYPLLANVPFETIVHQQQQQYYQALADSQSVGTSDPFIHFMLNALITALETEARRIPNNSNVDARLLAFSESFGETTFTRKDYQSFHPRISAATASRDLGYGVAAGRLTRRGEKRNTRYGFAGRVS